MYTFRLSTNVFMVKINKVIQSMLSCQYYYLCQSEGVCTYLNTFHKVVVTCRSAGNVINKSANDKIKWQDIEKKIIFGL